MSIHWDKVTRGEKGYEWPAFIQRVRNLKSNQIWRHNQAGDLEGSANVIDVTKLLELVSANTGRRGFTYTHYPMLEINMMAVRMANERGFTVNLSADSPAEADRLADLGIGPVTTLLPRGDTPRTTPSGRKITVCPAQSVEYMTCAVCQLCQNPKREAVVGFIVHGARFKAAQRVIEIKQEK